MSKHTSPDPPSQWDRSVPQAQEVSSSGTESDSKAVEDGEREGGDKLTSNKHSTLSLVMRKEEASEAEVRQSLSFCSATTDLICILLSCR